MPSSQQTSNTPESEKDSWRTPPWLFRFLTWKFGPFDVDLCADDNNALLPKYVTKEQNTLRHVWRDFGEKGFMNPPFSKPDPYVRHAYIEARDTGFSTVIVLPTHINQAWAALSQHATEVIHFEGRIDYCQPDGTLKRGNRGGSQVYWFRGNDLGFTRHVWVNTRELRKRFSEQE